ncbi:Bug family tripartite tricarboxylate transporter substrate binding protein [Aquabacter spiritensis]|nr:tripartite tricarboxylate transporter substrate binding protein [Aquabacter spiritensis]
MDESRILRRTLAAAVLWASATTMAGAQSFPEREIHLVVPFAAGGSTDFVARAVGQRVEKELGKPLVIENKPGANTIIGTRFVAQAKPDGYTLVLATNGHTTNGTMYRQLPYDDEADFTPIIRIGATPNVIAVNPKVKATTLTELLALAKADPGGLKYATAGNGTIQHLSGEMLAQRAGVKLEHIAYRGGGPASTDVMAGHVPILISGLPPAMPLIQTQRLRPLAVTGLERSPALPDVPTVASQGFPGFESSFWFAILGPAGMPPDIVRKLNTAFGAALKDPDFQKVLAREGVTVAGGSPEDLRAFMKQDKEKWGAVIKKSGIELIQ